MNKLEALTELRYNMRLANNLKRTLKETTYDLDKTYLQIEYLKEQIRKQGNKIDLYL